MPLVAAVHPELQVHCPLDPHTPFRQLHEDGGLLTVGTRQRPLPEMPSSQDEQPAGQAWQSGPKKPFAHVSHEEPEKPCGQVQVPEASTSLKTVEDLVGKKVATSFDFLAGEFFAKLDAKVNEARSAKGEAEVKTKIEYVGGSVEAACALGVADGIGESETEEKRERGASIWEY